MRCFGITKKFKRCENNCKILFCNHHRFQPFTLIVAIGAAIIYLTSLSESVGLKKPIDWLIDNNSDSLLFSYNKQVEKAKGMLSPKIVIELSPDKKRMRYYYHIENLGENTAYNILFSSAGPGVPFQLEYETPIERDLYKTDFIDYIPLTIPTFIELPANQYIKFLLWINYKVKINDSLKEFKCHYQKVMSKEELSSKSFSFDYGNCEENFNSPVSYLKELLDRNGQNNGKVTKIKEDVDKDFIKDLDQLKINSLPYQEEDIGSSIHLVIKLHQNPYISDHYIIDMGELNKNRVSLFLNTKNFLVFRVIDKNSTQYEASILGDSLKLSERYNYVNIEFGLNSKYSFLKILVNGKELVKNQYDYLIPFDTTAIKNMPFSLGADLNNRNYACFSIAELIIRTRTSSKDEKIELLNYIFKKERSGALLFDGKASMKSKNP